MKVYVLIMTCRLDNQSENEIVGVYDSVEKALERMKKEMVIARKDFESIETQETNYCEGGKYWCIWKTENDNYAHCLMDLRITEMEIE